MASPKTPVISNPWQALRQFTAARIALGRAGVSQPTAPQLDFQLAHARARDAVHLALDAQALAQAFAAGLPQVQAAVLLHSAAENRGMYLQRPDLGRKLDPASRAALQALPGAEPGASPARPWDLAFLIADGLSALAIEQNALPFMQALMRRLTQESWRIAPLAIACQGRVALGDEVGELLGAQAVVVLIGERPGLSSPDSMGLYLTWQPRTGLTDASRNCISNVRPAGMTYEDAAHKLHYLLSEARRRGLSGVDLKDQTGTVDGLADAGGTRFLL
jgi:ethanolamine ammonia-lyase small subunit